MQPCLQFPGSGPSGPAARMPTVVAGVFCSKLDRFAIGSPQPPPGGGLQSVSRRSASRRSARAARPLGCGLVACRIDAAGISGPPPGGGPLIACCSYVSFAGCDPQIVFHSLNELPPINSRRIEVGAISSGSIGTKLSRNFSSRRASSYSGTVSGTSRSSGSAKGRSTESS